ncbi:sulfotransferase [Psychroserpens sp.]|uniref:sulfotransferase n=1 Tax=Psychroserpens sp. TaxID=2020870 RepID=UPI001B1C75FC|nr:sulfotransferase [Psychroserpens sp.]MBO6606967.1 hypothetical protein [Psychroserpens sp.]MBO6630992.1 hypothetical protein [Psychroserpens sp.]MBO6654113.1 hypothetical protein [Psychroserpens sp.]MBO6682601.1 hypothetical protein [Psychroserpens sp.]MBO6750739.1 hypothetical protein [Psychroserpens sp.]
MSKKTHKVIVLGLPKTGTSTLAVMLRMLNYKVTGPDDKYTNGDTVFLDERFESYDGFQDFPWCFEWKRFLDDERTKFIILKRDRSSWWTSFYNSYGRKDKRYLSYPFMKIDKKLENEPKFLDFFESYYSEVEQQANRFPERFLSVNISEFEWEDLCMFLDEKLPKTIWGHVVKKPHVNKQKHKTAQTRSYKISNQLKKKISGLIGKENWRQLIIFLRKNGIIN